MKVYINMQLEMHDSLPVILSDKWDRLFEEKQATWVGAGVGECLEGVE